MTNWTKQLGLLSAVVAVGVIGVSVSHGEVSVDPFGSAVNTLVLASVVDDPNPIGMWYQHRPLAPHQVLNADGDSRGDGRPDIALRDNSWPVVAWAYNVGGDLDIAFAEWDGTRWTSTTFLTASTDDDRDPRLVVEPDGTTHIVWWTAGGTEEIYLATRLSHSPTWEPTVLVTDGAETGRRPSVTVFNGQLMVAYERDSASQGMAQDIVVATLQPGGAFAIESIGQTVRSEALDVMLHSDQDHLWAAWKHEAGEFGYAENQPGAGWTGHTSEPWINPSWIGVEETRKAIRTLVLE